MTILCSSWQGSRLAASFDDSSVPHFLARNIMPLFLILFFSFIISCATAPHLRDSQPTRLEILSRDYQSLAKCVTQKIEVAGVARNTQVSFNEREKMIKVYEPFGFVQDRNTFEFLFIQMKDNRTKVQSYGFETLVGRDHYPNQIWPFVMACASPEDSKTSATFSDEGLSIM